MSLSTRRAGLLPILIGIVAPAYCADVTVALDFQPQEVITGNDISSLPPYMLDKPVTLALVDSRGEPTDKIGQGTNDDDTTFAYRADKPVGGFVQSIVTQLAVSSGLHVDPSASLQLKLRLTGFSIEESNKPFGSMYGGSVRLAYTLEQSGETLCEGASEGSAHRYGQSASAENVAEVLSDATQEAFANVLADAKLRQAWASGHEARDNASDSIESKLEGWTHCSKPGKFRRKSTSALEQTS